MTCLILPSLPRLHLPACGGAGAVVLADASCVPRRTAPATTAEAAIAMTLRCMFSLPRKKVLTQWCLSSRASGRRVLPTCVGPVPSRWPRGDRAYTEGHGRRRFDLVPLLLAG